MESILPIFNDSEIPFSDEEFLGIISRSSESNPLTKDDSAFYTTARRTFWKEHLARVLARFCGCIILIMPTNPPSGLFQTGRYSRVPNHVLNFFFVGRKHDITLCRFLWDRLSIFVHAQSKTKVRSGRVEISSYCTGFIEGMLESIAKTMESMPERANDLLYSLEIKEQEATHYTRLSSYDIPDVSPCELSNIEIGPYKLGKFDGNSFNLAPYLFQVELDS